MSSAELMLCNCSRLPKKCCVAIQLCFGSFILALVMSSSISTDHTGIANYKLRLAYLNDREFLYSLSLLTKVFDTSYIVAVLLSGFLCLKYSAGRLFGIAIAGLSFLHIMSLLTTSVGIPELVIVTCVKGLLMGLTLSSVITICNIQASNLKDTTYVSLILFGFLFGYWLGEICLFNCRDYFWSLSFYIIGIFGLLWSVCWFWLFKDVSDAAVYYIHDGINASNLKLTKLLASMPRLCITIVALCAVLNFSLMNYIVVLNFEKRWIVYPQTFGMREFLICTTAASTLIVGWLSDFLRGYYTFSTTQVRKIFICGGLFGSSLILLFLLLSLNNYHYGIITICSCIGVFYILQGTLLVGFLVNALDIAPRFAGLVAGISFGSALIKTQIIIIITTQTFASYTNLDIYVDDQNTFFKAFVILIAFNISGGILFLKFGSGEEQKWAVVQDEDNRLIECIPDKKIILEEENQSQII